MCGNSVVAELKNQKKNASIFWDDYSKKSSKNG